MVPHLTIAPTGSLPELERSFPGSAPVIENGFRAQWQGHMPPFHASTDRRNAGFERASDATSLLPEGLDKLNAPRMQFKPRAFDSCCALPDAAQGQDVPRNCFRACGVVPRLARWLPR